MKRNIPIPDDSGAFSNFLAVVAVCTTDPYQDDPNDQIVAAGEKVAREAYLQGAKDALSEAVAIAVDSRWAYHTIAIAGVESVTALLEDRIDRGEWPK